MSTIFYENPSLTVFLVDIPASLAEAQEFLQQTPTKTKTNENTGEGAHDLKITDRRVILSSSPLWDPYPSLPEPKTAAARSRVLDQTPLSERSFYEIASPLIARALQEIASNHRGDWCSPRRVLSEAALQHQTRKFKSSASRARRDDRAVVNGEPPQVEGRQDQASKSILTEDGEPDLRVGADGSLSPHIPGDEPPLILSPVTNQLPSLFAARDTIVRNPSSVPTVLQITTGNIKENASRNAKKREIYQNTTIDSNQRAPRSSTLFTSFIIPPRCTFVLSSIPTPLYISLGITKNPIPSISESTKFNFILFDPPWPNRSVRRSSHYKISDSFAPLQFLVRDILKAHLDPDYGIAAIWVTNSAGAKSAAYGALRAANFHLFEEWVWVKTTIRGETVMPLDGVWRKPYEVLILGIRNHVQEALHEDEVGPGTGTVGADREITRRIIAAVPDVHSRKPNLKELLERIFFSSPKIPGSASGSHQENQGTDSEERHVRKYSALEVFARNLTAGWWACGDEVLRFNWEGWWR